MWIDARQHIASLVAVFLALGIGMLIGGTLPGTGGLHEQELTLIRNLERSLDRFELRNDELQTEIGSLRARWDAANRLNESLLGLAFEDRLSGLSINVLAAGAEGLEPIDWGDDRWAELRKLLDRSGADLFSVAPGPAGSSGGPGGTQAAPDSARVVVVRQGGGAAGWDRAWEQLSDWEAEAASLVVAQPSTVKRLPAHVTARDDPRLLIIDHVDTAAGILTLLEGLRTDVAGHYGVLDGAVARYPDVKSSRRARR